MKLPKFKSPPVVEVALSVQFQQPAGLSVAHLGLLWQRFRAQFPAIEQHAPLGRVLERRGVRTPNQEGQIVFSTDFETIPRLWMISESSDELLQVQGDKFVRNWRRYRDQGIQYPSYDTKIRPAFQSDFENFCQFIADEKLGELVVEQCEVTYINHIATCPVWERHDQLDKIFRGWSANYPALRGTKQEGVNAGMRHELISDSGDFLGRLSINIASVVFNADQRLGFLMQLVARGQPMGTGVDGVMKFLDYGHETIVSSFAELTTDEMHKVWERTQ